MNIKNIYKDWLLLISILIFWIFVAITLKVYPIGIVVYAILLSPLFAIGLFLSKRNAILTGFGFFIGFYIKQSICSNHFENPFNIILFLLLNPFHIISLIIIFIIFVGISVPLFTSIIGSKLNINQFRNISAGIIGFTIISAIYYFLFTCGFG